jgi:hypothetical protein
MLKRLLLVAVVLLTNTLLGFAQSKVTISGFIKDATSNEKIIGASIFIQELQIGTNSNAYGFYTITIPSGKYSVQYSHIGFSGQEAELDASNNISKDISLRPAAKDIGSVKIVAKKKVPIQQSTQTSMNSIPIAQIKALPAIFGEVDVLKALQLLPGVSGGTEGSSGIYVRGGGPDQNLFLLDGVPVYNVNHLGGFFSTFNADAISNVDLYKGGFPARFGGRLSSVVDIRLKEGNNKKFNIEGGIGVISSRLLVEGPIQKNKGSFMISGRRTYIDQLLRPIIKAQAQGLDAGYYFYDLNTKLNYKLTDKDHLYLSGYFGRDKFYSSFSDASNVSSNKSSTNGNLNWGNATGVLRWNHLFNNRLFGNLSASYTSYDYQVKVGNETYSTGDTTIFNGSLTSNIKDIAVKYDVEYTPSVNHNIKVGAGVTRHNFTPQLSAINANISGSKFDTVFNDQQIPAYETDIYAEDDWKVNDKLKLNVGAHFAMFNVQTSSYSSLQPRVSGRYLITKDYSIKASYAQMNQFINLLSFDGIGLPTDYWVPVTDKIKPQVSNQYAVAVAGTINKMFEASIEGYYKDMQNIIAYKDGTSYLNPNNSGYESIVEMGQGLCYGTEALLQKKEGKLQGLVGYTLSYAKRKSPTINFGEWYYYRYDRRHDFKIAAVYKLSEKIEWSGDWVYNTGFWLTIPTQTINSAVPSVNDVFGSFANYVELYPSRNNYNVKDYHRMDIAFRHTQERKRYSRSWAIGCYNLYGRRNTFFLIRDSDNLGNGVLRNVPLFGFPLPYIALNFKIKTGHEE